MALKSAMQMAAYWNMPETTAKTLVGGWLITGDMAYEDEDGDIYMLGRADDIINVGGKKVSPIEVENIAGQYDRMQGCACIGVEDVDGMMGQIPVLFAVAKSGYSEEELLKFIAARVERYKIPQKIKMLESFPRNSMQKFNYPYISRSITEYWRRWHISLGEWFRDYLYYSLALEPAVSLRKAAARKFSRKTASMISTAFILLAVWLSTGIWHGAN